jgi:hypothetical protein
LAICCEHGNEPSGFIKYGVFLESLSNRQFLKQNYVPQTYSLEVVRRPLAYTFEGEEEEKNYYNVTVYNIRASVAQSIK